MQYLAMLRLLCAFALGGALLAGCGPPSPTTDAPPEPEVTPFPTVVAEPTATEVIELTELPDPTELPAPTAVIELTELPDPTELPTPTELPAPTELPTPTELPAPTVPPLPTDPATEPTIDPAATPLYLWPASLPEPLAIDPAQSAADETGFVLELSDASGELQATILGGTYVTAAPVDDPPFGAEPTTIRGNEGYALNTGGGWGLHWREQDTHLSVVGNLPREMAFTIAESLEPVDLDTWQERLAQAAP